MQIKKIIQILWFSLWKLIWAILCYAIALTLALISGFFTYRFYSDGSTGNDFLAMSGMAIALEMVKLILAIGFPYLKDRDKKNENTILLVLKVSYVISVLSSLYYLLLGSDIAKSPASRTISMLYEYIPILDVIPLKFSQFIGTISLTILIEYFIILLPIIAPIMGKEKSPNRKIIAASNYEIIKEIITAIPQMVIDKTHKKVMDFIESKNNENNQIQIHSNLAQIKKLQKPRLRLVKRTDILKVGHSSNNDMGRKIESEYTPNTSITQNNENNPARNINTENNQSNTLKSNDSEDEILNNPAHDKFINNNTDTNKEELLKAIFELKENDACPSIKQLIEHTGFAKNNIHDIKKDFENNNIIKTEGNKTTVLCDYKEAQEKLNGGAVLNE